MLIKNHVGFSLFHNLQQLSSECENHAWVRTPTTRLGLGVLRGRGGQGTHSAVLKFTHMGRLLNVQERHTLVVKMLVA